MATKVIKLKLCVNREQAAALRQMSEQYREACNHVSRYVFEHGFMLDAYKLQKLMYGEMRGVFGLKAQMAVSVFRTVTARYDAVRTQLRNKPYRFEDIYTGKRHKVAKTLEWLREPVEFRRPQADLARERDYAFLKNGLISVNTLGKRAKVAYNASNFEQYLSGDWQLGTGKVLERNGKWYFHIPVSRADGEPFSTDTVKHVVGIDRGLRFLATTYDEQGKTMFFAGKKIAAKRNKFAKARGQLQSKDTKSAKRVLKRLSGRENRWMSDVNHRISKTLVRRYGANTLFVLEDLTEVSFEAQGRCDLTSWSFYQLEQFLSYKAHEVGSTVLTVNPKYTSQRCPKCGTIRKSNRKHDEHRYECANCGYKSNDDRVGAMNIQQLGALWVSGEENPNYDFQRTA